MSGSDESGMLSFALSSKRVLFHLAAGKSFFFKGKLRIRNVLSGKVRCLGSVLSSASPPRDVFSPKGYSLLNVECPGEDGDAAGAGAGGLWTLNHLTSTLGLSEEDAKTVLAKVASSQRLLDSGKGSWMILEHLQAPWTQILEDYLPHCQHDVGGGVGGVGASLFGRDASLPLTLPEPTEKTLDVNFYQADKTPPANVRVRLYRENPEWELAVQSMKITLNNLRQPRILVAGGKGVGKSTLVRYLANRILDEVGPLVILDLDPGQAEFTVPGCISCVRIEEPILGPNFTNQTRLKSYCVNLGEVNMSNVPRRFASQVAGLIKSASDQNRELNKLPWIINTMGFSRGLGIKLMKQTFRKAKPSTVVEIRSRFDKKNFPVDFFEQRLGQQDRKQPPFNVLRMEAMPESEEAKDMGVKDIWGINQPAKLRDIVVLSHFGQLYKGGPASRTFLQSVKPYQVSWDAVSVQILHADVLQPQDLPKLLNMSLVSLGVLSKNVEARDDDDVIIDDVMDHDGKFPRVVSNEEPVQALGFGFVRAVDSHRKLLYVVTPLPLADLAKVNCLSVGAVTLPKGIIVNQKHFGGGGGNNKVKNTTPYRRRLESRGGGGASPLAAPWQRYSKPKNFDS